MSLSTPFSRRLYLRIWLAVVAGIAVLTLTVGWAWRMAEEQKAQTNQPFVPPSREMALRDPSGQLLLRGMATRQPAEPGEGVEFRIESDTGQTFTLQMAPRQPRGEWGDVFYLAVRRRARPRQFEGGTALRQSSPDWDVEIGSSRSGSFAFHVGSAAP
eukprot:gene45187-60349_t